MPAAGGYGLGLYWVDLPCGRFWGHDGGTVGHQTISWHSPDGQRQVTYAQSMAFGIKPPPLADWIINLGEAAEYMFDHNLFQDNLVGVDFCERMVRETNPSVMAKAAAFRGGTA